MWSDNILTLPDEGHFLKSPSFGLNYLGLLAQSPITSRKWLHKELPTEEKLEGVGHQSPQHAAIINHQSQLYKGK